jgi:hypothetical protein
VGCNRTQKNPEFFPIAHRQVPNTDLITLSALTSTFGGNFIPIFSAACRLTMNNCLVIE